MEPELPANKTFKVELASQCGIVFFENSESGEKFLKEYLKCPKFREFIHPKLEPLVTMLLPKAARE